MALTILSRTPAPCSQSTREVRDQSHSPATTSMYGSTTTMTPGAFGEGGEGGGGGEGGSGGFGGGE